MMFRFPFSKTKESVVAVADIGSGSISIAILRLLRHGPSRIIVQEHATLPLEERTEAQTAARLIALIPEVAQRALAACRAGGNPAPGRIYAVAHAPWASSETFEAEESSDAERLVTEEHLERLGRKALAGRKASADTFETAIVKTELNGYPTSAAAGKRARTMRVAVLASRMKPEFRTAAEHALGTAFAGLPVVWRSHTRALLAFIADLPAPPRNFVVVDISVAGTSILVVRKGSVTASTHVAEAGESSILRKIAAEGLPEEVVAMLEGLARGTCDTQACQRLEETLGRTEPELTRIFGERFAQMAHERRLPDALLLIAHPGLAPWLERSFSRIDFAPFTVTARPFSVTTLSPQDFARTVTGDKPVADTSLACAATVVHIESRHRA